MYTSYYIHVQNKHTGIQIKNILKYIGTKKWSSFKNTSDTHYTCIHKLYITKSHLNDKKGDIESRYNQHMINNDKKVSF